VRDGIEAARRGTPAVALVTEQFWPQGDSVAMAAGMPDLPRLRLPHPVAGTGHVAMGRVADAVAGRIVSVLRGEREPDNQPVGAT
jgi:hypothetical protein